jgi:hypothetical protein
MIPFSFGGAGARRVVLVAIAGSTLTLVSATAAAAHSPDPQLGTSGALWAQDQVIPYRWSPGQAPPAWMSGPIDTAAADIGATRASRAATFTRTADATSWIAYGGWDPCPSYAIACMDRSGAPRSFAMWFRVHGRALDWGVLRWCQAQASFTDGCYDAENLALDELGHVEILGHHANYTDGSDYADSVVQASAHSRPKIGWNQHYLGRCDVARLQLEYELRRPGDNLSTCLPLATAATLGSSAASIYIGSSVRFTATLKVAVSSGARNLSGDPLSSRTVLLQRRSIGGTTWTTVATMAGTTVSGTYGVTWSPTGSYDWRAFFQPAAADGAQASSSTAVRVTVSGCGGGICPSSSGIRP